MSIEVHGFDQNMYMEMTYVGIEEKTGKTILVDPGTYNSKINNIIENSNGLEYIFLTHGHADHICELPIYKELYPRAKVVGSAKEKIMFNNSNINMVYQLTGKKLEFDPDIYVKDGDEISLGDTVFKFIETPGHTEGGMCILTEELIFTGDTLFRGDIGRYDLYGGDFLKLKNSIINKLFKLPENIIVYPGHGPSSSIGREKRYNIMSSII